MRTPGILLIVLFFVFGIISEYLPDDFLKKFVIGFSVICYFLGLYFLILADMDKKENPDL